MKIVLLGAPGSGKGTQAEYLVRETGYPHISTGDIFRDNIKRKTPLGIKIAGIIARGDFCQKQTFLARLRRQLYFRRISQK